MGKEISYGIIPLFHSPQWDYEVLLVQHKKGRHRGFPKGHGETDETSMETAQRECAEETWLSFAYIDPKMFKEHYQFSRKGDPIDKCVEYFIGITDDNEVQIDEKEIKAYVRLPLDQVRKKLTFYSARRVRDGAFRYLLGK